MKIFFASSLTLFLTSSLIAMEQSQPSVWIKTADSQFVSLDKTTAHCSNLLAALNEKYKGTKQDPLIIPSQTKITKNDIQEYWLLHRTLFNPFTDSANYHCALSIAEKMKDPVGFLQLLEQEIKNGSPIIPGDVTAKFIDPCIQIVQRTNLIKNTITEQTIFDNLDRKSHETPPLFITNDGHYLMHNLSSKFGSRLRLLNIEKQPAKTKNFFSTFSFQYAFSFSPDNRYCIVQGHPYIFVYNIQTETRYPLILPDYLDNVRTIAISKNSKHILIYGIKGNDTTHNRYALWSFDEHDVPQPVPLTAPAWKHIAFAFFHPKSEQIECNFYTKKLYSCPIATPNDLIKQKNKAFFFTFGQRSPLSDEKHLINYSQLEDSEVVETLFTISNKSNPIAIERQESADIIDRHCIPNKSLLTHITDNGTTLQLFGMTGQPVASHTTKNGTRICALATEPTGDYCASGYTDGTIIIWDLTDSKNRITGTKIQMPGGKIRSLTFTGNQLLLCQSGKIISGSSSEKTEPPTSAAILCDVHGNIIRDFGLTMASAISTKGNRIVTVSENIGLDWFNGCVNAKAWYLHNKKIKQELDKPMKPSELFELSRKYSL